MNRRILLCLVATALVTLACGIQFDVPITTDVKTGPTQTLEIFVPSLDDPETIADIMLAFGGGDLFLTPGAEEGIISGTATYNVQDFEPQVTVNQENIKVDQGNLEISGIPDFDEKIINRWDLKLGSGPMKLVVKAGAYVGDYELGGLSLHELHISDGAAEVDITFSEPNLIVMDTLRYETGASSVTLNKLANANFKTMIFESGAGNYDIDFSGILISDASVFIESGLSNVTISVPKGVPATVSFEGGFTNISDSGSWKQSGENYVQYGEGAGLTITVEMNAGNLRLRNP